MAVRPAASRRHASQSIAISALLPVFGAQDRLRFKQLDERRRPLLRLFWLTAITVGNRLRKRLAEFTPRRTIRHGDLLPSRLVRQQHRTIGVLTNESQAQVYG